MLTNIIKCARCGENHNNIEIMKLTNPIEIPNANGYKIDHWTMCPNLNEPILITVLDEV